MPAAQTSNARADSLRSSLEPRSSIKLRSAPEEMKIAGSIHTNHMPVGRDSNGFEVAETVSRLEPGGRPAFANVSALPASARPNPARKIRPKNDCPSNLYVSS